MNLAEHAAKLRRDKRTEFWRRRAEKMTAIAGDLQKENRRLSMIVAAYRSRARDPKSPEPTGQPPLLETPWSVLRHAEPQGRA